ncbi:MAG: hypothetical protein K0R80_751 [Clostridia bacterium]|jgi:hypothetical protein|nr:hypothetical protein [Clostridia bacterium]
MKKLVMVLLVLILAFSGFAGCSEQNISTDGQKVEQAGGAPENSATKSASGDNSSVTLAEIRKSAEGAGYNVSDGHQLVYMDDVAEGFTVQIIADNQDVLYSVIECKTEDAAIKNAKAIDDAGYNIAIRNGKILSCYGVDKKDGISKDILASIVVGKPISNK